MFLKFSAMKMQLDQASYQLALQPPHPPTPPQKKILSGIGAVFYVLLLNLRGEVGIHLGSRGKRRKWAWCDCSRMNSCIGSQVTILFLRFVLQSHCCGRNSLWKQLIKCVSMMLEIKLVRGFISNYEPSFPFCSFFSGVGLSTFSQVHSLIPLDILWPSADFFYCMNVGSDFQVPPGLLSTHIDASFVSFWIVLAYAFSHN